MTYDFFMKSFGCDVVGEYNDTFVANLNNLMRPRHLRKAIDILT